MNVAPHLGFAHGFVVFWVAVGVTCVAVVPFEICDEHGKPFTGAWGVVVRCCVRIVAGVLALPILAVMLLLYVSGRPPL